MKDHIIVIHENEAYEIYKDGIVYHTSCNCQEDDNAEHDIPDLVFYLRDTYVDNLGKELSSVKG